MREILFKAKRKSDGEWIYGTGLTDFLNIEPDSKDKMWLWCDYVYPDSLGKRWVEINPKTICQYTGETDEEGNKVFEDDLINCRVRQQGEDCYDCERCYFMEEIQVCFVGGANYVEETPHSHRYYFDDLCIESVEGNIHDNLDI